MQRRAVHELRPMLCVSQRCRQLLHATQGHRSDDGRGFVRSVPDPRGQIAPILKTLHGPTGARGDARHRMPRKSSQRGVRKRSRAHYRRRANRNRNPGICSIDRSRHHGHGYERRSTGLRRAKLRYSQSDPSQHGRLRDRCREETYRGRSLQHRDRCDRKPLFDVECVPVRCSHRNVGVRGYHPG